VGLDAQGTIGHEAAIWARSCGLPIPALVYCPEALRRDRAEVEPELRHQGMWLGKPDLISSRTRSSARRRTLEVLDELLNCCAGNDLKAMAGNLSRQWMRPRPEKRSPPEREGWAGRNTVSIGPVTDARQLFSKIASRQLGVRRGDEDQDEENEYADAKRGVRWFRAHKPIAVQAVPYRCNRGSVH
jgi:hypothetical protein